MLFTNILSLITAVLTSTSMAADTTEYFSQPWGFELSSTEYSAESNTIVYCSFIADGRMGIRIDCTQFDAETCGTLLGFDCIYINESDGTARSTGASGYFTTETPQKLCLQNEIPPYGEELIMMFTVDLSSTPEESIAYAGNIYFVL